MLMVRVTGKRINKKFLALASAPAAHIYTIMKILSSLRAMLDWVVARSDATFSWVAQRLDTLFGEVTTVVDSLIRVGTRVVVFILFLQILDLDLVSAVKNFLEK